MSHHWKDKIANWEATPPPAAWDAIAAGLDDAQKAFPQKLYNYTEQPPATTWDRIEAQLPVEAAKVKALPLRKQLLRYAAAAILLLALAGIAYFTTAVNNNTTVASNAISRPAATPPAKRGPKHFNVPPQPTESIKEKADEPVDTRVSKKEFHTNKKERNKQPTQRSVAASLPLEPLFATELDVVPEEKTIVDANRADRYMIATSDEGQPVRLPKKVYSAFACPDKAPRRQACELERSLLQQKMSASFTTDFAHFLDLLKNLQENYQ